MDGGSLIRVVFVVIAAVQNAVGVGRLALYARACTQHRAVRQFDWRGLRALRPVPDLERRTDTLTLDGSTPAAFFSSTSASSSLTSGSPSMDAARKFYSQHQATEARQGTHHSNAGVCIALNVPAASS